MHGSLAHAYRVGWVRGMGVIGETWSSLTNIFYIVVGHTCLTAVVR